MADSLNYEDFIRGINKLKKDQQKVIFWKLKSILEEKEKNSNKPEITIVEKHNEAVKIEIIDKPQNVDKFENINKPHNIITCCPHCGGTSIKKHGKTKGDVQRYTCKNEKCRKNFTENYGLITHYTHLEEWEWREIIRGTIENLSLKKIAENCNHRSVSTIWSCRMKIYQAIKSLYDYCDKLSGIVETDGKYTQISFKGYKNPNYFIDTLGRLPRHHRSRSEKIEYLEKCGRYKDLFVNNPKLIADMLETDQKTLSGQDTIDRNHQKACILTAIDENNNIYIEPVSAGTATRLDIYKKFHVKITSGSILVTDRHRSYKFLTKRDKIEHINILAKRHRGKGYNLARVNSLHSRMKADILENYKPATKYLDLYLMMFWWLEKNKRCDSKFDMLCDMMLGCVDYDSRQKMKDITIDSLVSRKLPIDTKGYYGEAI